MLPPEMQRMLAAASAAGAEVSVTFDDGETVRISAGAAPGAAARPVPPRLM